MTVTEIDPPVCPTCGPSSEEARGYADHCRTCEGSGRGSSWLPDHDQLLLVWTVEPDVVFPYQAPAGRLAIDADDMPRLVVGNCRDAKPLPDWWQDDRMTMSVTTTGSVDVGDRVWLMQPDGARQPRLVERVVGHLVTLGEPER